MGHIAEAVAPSGHSPFGGKVIVFGRCCTFLKAPADSSELGGYGRLFGAIDILHRLLLPRSEYDGLVHGLWDTVPGDHVILQIFLKLCLPLGRFVQLGSNLCTPA